MWDKNHQVFQRDTLGFYEKEHLHKELRNEVDYQAERVVLIMENELHLIFKELESIEIETIEFVLNASISTVKRDLESDCNQ